MIRYDTMCVYVYIVGRITKATNQAALLLTDFSTIKIISIFQALGIS